MAPAGDANSGSPSVEPFSTVSPRPNSLINYPSPFFDIASTYMPSTIKGLFRWARYYFYTNPIIHRACLRLSKFAITEFIIESDDLELKKKWAALLRKIRARDYAMNIGLDYVVYGNGFSSIYYPKLRILKCKECGQSQAAKAVKVEFKKYQYTGKCSECKQHTTFESIDKPIKDASKLHVLRWNPENMDVEYNEITGQTAYSYNLPNRLKRRVRQGIRHVVDGMENDVLRHVKENRPLKINPDNIYHIKQSALASQDMGWGFPSIVSAMKTLFLAQIFNKTREVVAFQHIIPLWILFPQPGNDINPFEHLDMASWRAKVESEVLRWRRDPNYISVMPIPMGFHFIGGDYNNMAGIVNDIQELDNRVMAGMGVPQEFVFGGTSWSATSITARMLENDLNNYVTQIEDLFNDFLIPKLSAFMQIEPVSIKMTPIKMVDDVQQKQLRFQMAQMGKLSWESFMEEFGYIPEEEFEKIKEEQKKIAEIEGSYAIEQEKQNFAVGMENTKEQLKMQAIMPVLQEEAMRDAMKTYGGSDLDPMDPNLIDKGLFDRVFKGKEDGTAQSVNESANWQYVPFNPSQLGEFYAKQLGSLKDEGERNRLMGEMQNKMPMLHTEVSKYMGGVDMRPQPEQKPPRRDTRSV